MLHFEFDNPEITPDTPSDLRFDWFPHLYGFPPDEEAFRATNALDVVAMGLYRRLGWCRPVGRAEREQARAALAQVGLPYLWGGDGPARGDAGFDCSGLVVAAYASAGIQLPRTAQAQYDTGPLLPAGTPLQPGDLLFFGTPTHVHHVGIYTGTPHRMVDAAHTGTLIRVEDYPTWPDLLAASRPAA